MYIDRICSSFDKSNWYQIEECKHWAVVITDQKYHTAILVPADSSDQEVQQLVKKWLHENIMVKLEDCSENLRAQVFDLWNNPDDMHAWYIEEESNRKSELEKKEQLLQELYRLFGKQHPIHQTYQEGEEDDELLIFLADFQSYFLWK